jgi:acyl-coenzyme A synthetase/AMP-(fatty) acid ligase
MTSHPASLEHWQSFPSTLDPIHVAWLKQAKKSRTAFEVADQAEINKDELKKLLTNTKTNPLYRPAKVLFVEEIPKLGSVKIDFSATKKIALVNNQK